MLAGPGDARGSDGDGGAVPDGAGPGRYRWVSINRGYKLGTETIQSQVLSRCRARHVNKDVPLQYDAEEGLGAMYNIGLVRDPLARFVSGYKVRNAVRFPPVAAPRIARAGTERAPRVRPQETLYRLQKYSVKYANDYEPPPSWYDRESANVSDYPGLGAAERCVDWMWALPVHRVGKIGEEAYREGEARPASLSDPILRPSTQMTGTLPTR